MSQVDFNAVKSSFLHDFGKLIAGHVEDVQAPKDSPIRTVEHMLNPFKYAERPSAYKGSPLDVTSCHAFFVARNEEQQTVLVKDH